MRKVVRIVAVTLLLAAWSSIPVLAVSPVPAPLCWPAACPSN
jgi:hypothetical protein